MTGGVFWRSTLFYNLYCTQRLPVLQDGYASALAWVMFLIILAFTLLIFKSSPLWVYYEGRSREIRDGISGVRVRGPSLQTTDEAWLRSRRAFIHATRQVGRVTDAWPSLIIPAQSCSAPFYWMPSTR
jgi:hypothetical protein